MKIFLVLETSDTDDNYATADDLFAALEGIIADHPGWKDDGAPRVCRADDTEVMSEARRLENQYE